MAALINGILVLQSLKQGIRKRWQRTPPCLLLHTYFFKSTSTLGVLLGNWYSGGDLCSSDSVLQFQIKWQCLCQLDHLSFPLQLSSDCGNLVRSLLLHLGVAQTLTFCVSILCPILLFSLLIIPSSLDVRLLLLHLQLLDLIWEGANPPATACYWSQNAHVLFQNIAVRGDDHLNPAEEEGGQ